MTEQQRYQEAVHGLEIYGYQVIPDMQGYLIHNRNDPHDISRARDLDDLLDLADLVAWAARRREQGATT